MIRSFQRLENVNPGFDSNSVLAVRIVLPMRPGEKPDGRDGGFFRTLLEGLNAIPGVQHAGLISELPLSGQANDTFFTIEGRPTVKPSERPNADDRWASPGYFEAMGIPILKGRNFNDGDTFSGAKVAIVSKTLADRFFKGQEPLGQHLNIDHGLPFECEIVGVAGDVLHRGLALGTYPTMYVPYAQATGRNANLVIRSRTNPLTLVDAVKKQVEGLNPDIPVFGFHALGDFVADSVGQPRFRTLLLAVFAGVALLLAAAGIYGVMSYSVTLRMHEIGIRVALGARRMQVMRAVVGRGILWALAGVATGLAAALALARLIATMLYEVQPSDPVSFTVVPLVLVTVALLASYLPARRATKVDAMVALRHD
jgi:putative ABC transport system permease protein